MCHGNVKVLEKLPAGAKPRTLHLLPLGGGKRRKRAMSDDLS